LPKAQVDWVVQQNTVNYNPLKGYQRKTETPVTIGNRQKKKRSIPDPLSMAKQRISVEK
jgi:hypothetical protein